MKCLLTVSLLVVIPALTGCVDYFSVAQDGDNLLSTIYEFGRINAGESVKHTFKVKINGLGGNSEGITKVYLAKSQEPQTPVRPLAYKIIHNECDGQVLTLEKGKDACEVEVEFSSSGGDYQIELQSGDFSADLVTLHKEGTVVLPANDPSLEIKLLHLSGYVTAE